MTGVRHCYNVLKDPGDLRRVALVEYKRFQSREAKELERVQDVLKLVRADGCHGRRLREYFGERPESADWACGDACQYCLTRAPVAKLPPAAKRAHDAPALLKLLEAAVASNKLPKDSPRLLARYAFGVSSPRIAQLRRAMPDGNTKRLFGAFANVLPFHEVLAGCERICDRTDDAT